MVPALAIQFAVQLASYLVLGFTFGIGFHLAARVIGATK